MSPGRPQDPRQVSHLLKAGKSVAIWMATRPFFLYPATRPPMRPLSQSPYVDAWRPASDRSLGNDVSAFLSRAVSSSSQEEWTNTQSNKLKVVKSSGEVWLSFSYIMKEEVFLTRLRTGDTRLTHGHLLRGEQAPVCRVSGAVPAVLHILLDWRRPRYFPSSGHVARSA
jgi:hypothetical protein